MRHFTSAVILSAGEGKRFGGDIKKQYSLICNEPCIVHTLRAFDSCKLIDEIILVGNPAELEACLEGYKFEKLKKTVGGGATRQISSKLGFEAISEKADYVAIHDGARCLITPSDIEKTVRSAYKHRAAVAAVRCTDTVKFADKKENIAKTGNRDEIWLAATPQVFLCDMYLVASAMAEKDGAAVTDDASMCERLGFKVYLSETADYNYKLTKPSDAPLFEAIMNIRKTEIR